MTVPEETPLAPCTVVWSHRSKYWSVTVLRCPFCRRKHYHGGGDGPEPLLGSRVAHCVDGPGGTYDLIAETSPHGCLGEHCAVRIGHRVHRCSGCEWGAA